MDLEKLYTVEDIANMTNLTTRTIRNYLKNGSLKGRKVGGQWRFSVENIRALMDSGSVAAELAGENRQSVLDFLDGVNTDLSGEVQVCCIIDLYKSKEEAKAICDQMTDRISGATGFVNFHYAYDEQEGKARFTLFANPSLVGEFMLFLS